MYVRVWLWFNLWIYTVIIIIIIIIILVIFLIMFKKKSIKFHGIVLWDEVWNAAG